MVTKPYPKCDSCGVKFATIGPVGKTYRCPSCGASVLVQLPIINPLTKDTPVPNKNQDRVYELYEKLEAAVEEAQGWAPEIESELATLLDPECYAVEESRLETIESIETSLKGLRTYFRALKRVSKKIVALKKAM